MAPADNAHVHPGEQSRPPEPAAAHAAEVQVGVDRPTGAYGLDAVGGPAARNPRLHDRRGERAGRMTGPRGPQVAVPRPDDPELVVPRLESQREVANCSSGGEGMVPVRLLAGDPGDVNDRPADPTDVRVPEGIRDERDAAA